MDTAYRGSSVTLRSMKEWRPGLGSARSDYNDSEKDTLVARSRDADRNGIGRAIHERIPANAIGSGLDLQSVPDHRILGLSKEEVSDKAREIEAEFDYWSENCDIERRLTFKIMQYQIMLASLMSGDVFINTPYLKRKTDRYGLKLQVIEGDRVRNPMDVPDNQYLIGGVSLDAYGAPEFYYILNYHPGEDLFYNVNDWQKIPVFDAKTGRRRVLHVYLSRRPGQERGEPILAPVLEPIKQLDRYRANELMASVVASMFTAFIKTDVGAGLPSLGNGAVVGISPDEDITIANPGRPNSQYGPFMEAGWKELGAIVGLPYEELMQVYNSSYSASRAAIIQAWKLYKLRRSWLVAQCINPIYKLFLDEAVAFGYLDLPGYNNSLGQFAWAKADWIGPTMADIDPEKTVKAASQRMELGITNLAIETSEMTGRDWEDVNDQTAYIKDVQATSGTETKYEEEVGGQEDALPE